MSHEGVLAFGCGCKKGSQSVVGQATRSTVYQVVGPNQAIVGEFSTLPEARSKAIEVQGRVKVTSQVG